jgi:serine/threonine protein kinase
MTQFYNIYKSKEPKLHDELKGIPLEVFLGANASPLMQRITDYQGWIGNGTGGFVMKALYHPLNGDPFVAAIKLLPCDSDFETFDDNIILAKLTGDMMTDKYNSERQNTFSYDDSEARAEININPENRNPYAANINQFYEMEKVTVGYKRTEISPVKNFYMTILVTAIGKCSLVGKLFGLGTDRNNNTINLLNYWFDITKAGRNVNAQGILHGDIKPDNMILVPSDKDYKVEFIDFDLIFDPKVEDYSNRQLRYTSGFRAPWISPTLKIVGYDSQNQPKLRKFYKFDTRFVEDSYAIAKSIKEIYQFNVNQINAKDVSIIKILNYMQSEIINKASLGPQNVPTTAEVYEFVKSVLKNREQDLAQDMLMKEKRKSQVIVTSIKKPSSQIMMGAQPKYQPFRQKTTFGDLVQAQINKKYRII